MARRVRSLYFKQSKIASNHREHRSKKGRSKPKSGHYRTLLYKARKLELKLQDLTNN